MIITKHDQPGRIRIFEGTDGVGKSSLSDVDARVRGADYIHASAPTHDDWFKEYVMPVVDPDKKFTLDRWHLGEMVWPKIFDRDSLFGDDLEEYVECCKSLARLGAELFLIIRPVPHIITELESRGETRDQIRDSCLAQEMFIAAAEFTRMYMPVEIHTMPTMMMKIQGEMQ